VRRVAPANSASPASKLGKDAHRFCLFSGPEGNFGAGGGGFAILSFGVGTGFCTVTGFGGVNTFEGVCTFGFDCVGSFSQPRSVRPSPGGQGAIGGDGFTQAPSAFRSSPLGHGDSVVGVGVFTGASCTQLPFGPSTSPGGQVAGTVHLPFTMI